MFPCMCHVYNIDKHIMLIWNQRTKFWFPIYHVTSAEDHVTSAEDHVTSAVDPVITAVDRVTIM